MCRPWVPGPLTKSAVSVTRASHSMKGEREDKKGIGWRRMRKDRSEVANVGAGINKQTNK